MLPGCRSPTNRELNKLLHDRNIAELLRVEFLPEKVGGLYPGNIYIHVRRVTDLWQCTHMATFSVSWEFTSWQHADSGQYMLLTCDSPHFWQRLKHCPTRRPHHWSSDPISHSAVYCHETEQHSPCPIIEMRSYWLSINSSQFCKSLVFPSFLSKSRCYWFGHHMSWGLDNECHCRLCLWNCIQLVSHNTGPCQLHQSALRLLPVTSRLLSFFIRISVPVVPSSATRVWISRLLHGRWCWFRGTVPTVCTHGDAWTDYRPWTFWNDWE